MVKWTYEVPVINQTRGVEDILFSQLSDHAFVESPLNIGATDVYQSIQLERRRLLILRFPKVGQRYTKEGALLPISQEPDEFDGVLDLQN
jgi:hypothetical protein